MGITFYLKGDISMAIKCYAVCSRFAALSIPEILQDYQAMRKGDTEAKDRLLAGVPIWQPIGAGVSRRHKWMKRVSPRMKRMSSCIGIF